MEHDSRTPTLQRAVIQIFGVNQTGRQPENRSILDEAKSKMKAPVDIAGLARLILSDECRSIAILSGAGVSVSSGIPDFRSPGGFYSTLRPELITASPAERHLMSRDPTYVVSWQIFQHNQFPYLEVRRPFILGTQRRTWKATIAHHFASLLHTKTNKLTRIYTQNIDGLDYQLDDIPKDKIVAVHGSIALASCEGCGKSADMADFCQQLQTNIKDIYNLNSDSDHGNGNNNSDDAISVTTATAAPKESTPILCQHCHEPLVKPSTVLFGRNLPLEFFQRAQQDLPTLDVLIVAGTSLVVSPANALVHQAPDTTCRVIVNREPVGRELGIEYDDDIVVECIDAASGGDDHCRTSATGRDLFAQGDCDAVFLHLIQELGWMEDLWERRNDLPPSSADLLRRHVKQSADKTAGI
jgi:NAD+-dependent protein deacetylase sirtuin 2